MPKTETPRQTGIPWLALLGIIAITAACTAIMATGGADIDSFYMIPLGNDILENGIPRTYDVSFYPDMQLVAQQWLYAVLMAIAAGVPNGIGIALLHFLQLAVFYIMVYAYLSKHYDDPFWAWLAATFTTFGFMAVPYMRTVRPEIITLILLLSQIMALDRYTESRKTKWLAISVLPLILEMNLHMTMWPFHFCILAAYLVPIPQKICAGRNRWDWKLATTALPMAMTLFLQPYGIHGITHIFRSMRTFQTIAITEQVALALTDKISVLIIFTATAITILAIKRKLEPAELYLSTGLVTVSTLNLHAAMMMPLAIAPVAAAMLRTLASKNPARAEEIIPKNIKIAGSIIAICILATSVVTTINKMPQFMSAKDMVGAIEYLAENNDGNVLCQTDDGSILAYYGLAGRIMGDSRHEQQDISINRSVNGLAYINLFTLGSAQNQDIQNQLTARYGENPIEGYLEHWNIKYIMLPAKATAYQFLDGWVSNSNDWAIVDHKSADAYHIWTKIE